MTPDQQRALAATYGLGWPTADLLLSDDGIAHAKASMAAGSMRRDDPDASRYYETTARGIVTYRLTAVADPGGWPKGTHRSDVVLAVPWAAVKAHRAALPPAVLDRLCAARNAHREHHRAYPTPYPDLGVRKVGPSSDIHPDDRELYHERHAEWARDRLTPWIERARELDTALADAIRACLPALDGEPADLLEHLAAMEATA